jgi:hypothetical protein
MIQEIEGNTGAKPEEARRNGIPGWGVSLT